MKPNTTPIIPPALRKARKPEEISNAFPPIIARPRPEPPPPAVIAPAPVVAAPAPPAPVVPVPSPAAPKPASPPTVKAALPSTVKPVALPPLATNPPTLKTRPKTSFKGRSPIAELDGRVVLFAGTFRPDGEPDFEVQTPLTGDPRRDRQAIINIARTKFPKGGLSLKSTRIFSKELGARVSYPKGTSVGQLFGESGSPTENAIEVAEVFFQGERCSVFLRNLKSRNSVTVALRAPGGNPIVFSNQIASNSPAHTLAMIIREVLGQDCRELKVTVQVEK